MRILLIAPQPFYVERGTPIAVRLLVEELAALGHQVDLLTYHEGESVALDNVRIVRIARPPGVHRVPIGPSWKKIVCDVFLAAKLIRMTRRGRYDIIHAVEESAMLATLLRFWHRTPIVVDMDSSIPAQLKEKYPWAGPLLWLPTVLERSAIRRAVATVAVCDSLARVARSADPRGPVHTIPDVAMEFPDPQGSAEPLRSSLNIAPDIPIILYVGNLQRYQGVDLLLDAFRTVQSPSALVIVGGDDEQLRRYRPASGDLDGRVYWAGPRPLQQLTWLLRQADVLVSPRLKGVNTPMKIYSYLASGVATVATRIESHTQVLDDQVSVLADPEPTSFGSGIDALLVDPSHRRQLGDRARELADREYSRVAFNTRVAELYDEIQRSIQT